MNLFFLLKQLREIIFAVGLYFFGTFQGKKIEQTKQLKKTLKNAEENQKFKQTLDAVRFDDKRKFLREKFGRK